MIKTHPEFVVFWLHIRFAKSDFAAQGVRVFQPFFGVDSSGNGVCAGSAARADDGTLFLGLGNTLTTSTS